ncbi:DUF2752 domain-containing protein [Streptosporangium roseum]|uniref:DUF2752 domain-containing protein n=1 Tax=Streptosporangium roseum (strain ATCC 12428 / DSM 43021 / JCM 3005 / KCTC 9067 / NCIMB 10171 / NRRL 2505 / NI 9100) TaxID=479432 RepID=D2B8A3_STRRD|nr:DUF2752 domain-containing protein [Streptosporangium roseum]ACZ85893.1 conserved hypothetical protein [Streptosporangium roseum DSM 43021]
MVTERTADVRGPRARALAVLAPLGAALAAGAAVAYVGVVDPNEPGHYPTCPFLMLTGLYCPGCGGLRAVHALAHGDPVTALGLNLLVVVMVPVLAFLWGRWALRSWRGAPLKGISIHPSYVWAFLALMIVFWIVRNVAFGEFLAP